MRRPVRRFVRERSGATAIEYAMIAALIALTLIASITAIGKTVAKTFTEADNGFSASASAS